MTKYLKVFDIEDACVSVCDSDIRPGLVSAYKRNPVEIKALLDWVVKADRTVIPALKSLSGIITRLEPTTGTTTLYRGFNPNSFQESLGFTEADEIEVGMKGLYKTTERSFSTSTHLDIAKQFGSIVIRCDVNLNNCDHLNITDPLAFIISEHQCLGRTLSQKEVILFPPINVNWEVVHIGN